LSPSPHSRASALNRLRLIKRVRNDWIDGILRHSYRTGHLALGLRPMPEATERLWDVVVHHADDEASQALPSTARISSVFEDFEEQLLILGAPGAGKTATLLELARDLLDRAQQDPLYPVPVVLNLSTWAGFKGTFEEWLIDELSKRYGVPKKVGQAWISDDEVLPLLDGLDEVSPNFRENCIHAINGYHLEHCALAVCSRLGDYESLATRLHLRGAVAIQPLTREQTRTYLNQAGNRLGELLAALEEDESLWEILDTPLMLNVASLAYAEQTANKQGIGTLQERRRQLFANYVDAVFQRAGRTKPVAQSAVYTRAKTLSSLRWLATAMKLNGQSVLYLGWMQPTWLRSNIERIGYRLVCSFFGASVFAMAFAIWFVIAAVFALKNGHSQFGDSWADLINASLFIAKLFGAAGGLIFLVRQPVAVAMLGALFVPVLEKIGMHQSFKDAESRLLGMIIFAFAFWVAARAIGTSDFITPVERVRWSWDKAKTKLRAGLWAGSAAGLILGLLFATAYALGPNNGYKGVHSNIKHFVALTWVAFFLFAAIAPSLFGAVLGVITAGSFGGFFRGVIETRMLPNEEIWRPAKTIAIEALVGLIFVCIAPVIHLPNLWLLTWFAVACGLILLLRLGGLPFIEHWSLRLVLAIRGYTPWNYVRFLNYASDLILLRRAGGGFIFLHLLLLDHFAAIDEHQARPEGKVRELVTPDKHL
jgi:DNA polymerase III delta prime subunit